MNRFIKGLAASAAIVALSSVAMAQGQGGSSGSTGATSSGQATWPDNNSPDPNARPGTGSVETTGAMPSGGTTDKTPSNSNSGAGSAMQPAPTPGNTPAEEAATGPKQ
jgi:hypothetical protein